MLDKLGRNDPVEFLMPRILTIVGKLASVPMSCLNEFDKVVFASAEGSVAISYDTLRALLEADDFTGIDRAVCAAVDYVSSEMGPLYDLADKAKQ